MANFFEQVKNIFSFEKKSELDLMNPIGWRSQMNWNRRSFTGFSHETAAAAYSAHELVFACIQKTADVMNDADICVERFDNKTQNWEKVAGHPLTSLFKRPNPYETGKDFRRLQTQSELSTGIFYCEIVRSRAGFPVELLALNPNKVQPVINRAKSEIDYFEYTRGDGSRKRIERENMLIRRRVDLVNRWGGLAPLEVALKSINSDLGLTDYVDAFFTNDGTPSGILTVLNASLTEPQKKEVAASWRAKYSRGGSNAKGIAVLDQAMNFQTIGSKLNELSSEELSGRFESRICSVFGVPPILVGAQIGLRHTTANATMKSALNDFWDNKVSPELATLREWLTWFLLPEFENIEDIKAERVRVNYDLSQCKWLMDDVAEIQEQARKGFMSDGLTQNEYRAALGKEETESGDRFRSEIIAATRSAGAMLTGGEMDANEPKQLPGKSDALETIEKKTENLEYWRELSLAEQSLDLKSLESDLETNGAGVEKSILKIRKDLIEQAATEAERLALENIGDINLAISSKHQKELEKLLKSAFETGANQVIREIAAQTGAKALEFKREDFDISTVLQLVLARIIFEIKNRAVNVAAVLYALGKFSAKEMRDALDGESEKVFTNWSKNFANLAIQSGRESELESADVSHYSYSAILDKRVCNPCKKMDGKTASKLSELPTTPFRDCEGLWNCRCFIVGVSRDEA